MAGLYSNSSFLPSLLSALSPTTRWLRDWYGNEYEFSVHSIESHAYGVDAVYIWLNTENRILYIGRAEDLSARLSHHERLDEAKARGASQLWVHRTGSDSKIHFHDVERNLIQTFSPPMNYQHTATFSQGLLSAIIAG